MSVEATSAPGMARVVGPEVSEPPTSPAFTSAVMPVAPQPSGPDVYVAHWSHLLKEALGPSEREQAAHALANGPRAAYADSVALLLESAEHDPAATVRAACVRCLVKMNVKTPAASALVNRLKADADPRVRTEAEWAQSVLSR